jgi:hypothetical protein
MIIYINTNQELLHRKAFFDFLDMHRELCKAKEREFEVRVIDLTTGKIEFHVFESNYFKSGVKIFDAKTEKELIEKNEIAEFYKEAAQFMRALIEDRISDKDLLRKRLKEIFPELWN